MILGYEARKMKAKLIILALVILNAPCLAGQMITPNNPVAFTFDSQVIHENGTRTVYISDHYMMPHPESDIIFVYTGDDSGCRC